MIFTIMASDFSGIYMESLPDLDKFLASSFGPHLPDNEEKVGEKENADSLRVNL